MTRGIGEAKEWKKKENLCEVRPSCIFNGNEEEWEKKR